MKTVYCGAEKKSEFKAEGGNASTALTIPMMAVSSDQSKQADGKDKDEKPEKSHPWSDVSDAFQYMCLHADGGETFGVTSYSMERREVSRVSAGGWT